MGNYLYGPDKIELPPLPEWDKERFPYARLRRTTPSAEMITYSVHAYPVKPITIEKAYTNPITGATGTTEYTTMETEGEYLSVCYIDLSMDEWYVANTVYTGKGEEAFAYTRWANFDIYHADGTLYLAASDPVPVPRINPSVLMQGFFVGVGL